MNNQPESEMIKQHKYYNREYKHQYSILFKKLKRLYLKYYKQDRLRQFTEYGEEFYLECLIVSTIDNLFKLDEVYLCSRHESLTGKAIILKVNKRTDNNVIYSVILDK